MLSEARRLILENAAPSTALPLGSSRILSPTRLTRVDPSGPAHITRLLNTVLAVVHLVPGDRIRKAPKEAKDIKADVDGADVKVEPNDDVKREEAGEEKDQSAHGADVKAEGETADEEPEEAVEEDEDEDEVPYVEEIGWREVTGFIVM